MLVVVNLTSIPVSIFSYYQGIKLRNAKGSISVENEDPKFYEKMILTFKAVIPYGIRIIIFWFLLSATIMTITYIFNFWKPH